MLGLLNILYLVATHPSYSHDILLYSQNTQNQFPLAATLINMTTFLLTLLYSHSLDSLLGPDRQTAFQVFSQLFCVCAMALLNDYRDSGASIREMGSLMQST